VENRSKQKGLFSDALSVKKNPAKQDSPPAAGRASDILPFRRSACDPCEAFLFYRTHFPMKQ